MSGLSYFIKTYGCQMNVYDSERMAGLLESMGYSAAGEARDADLILLNTCSVRDKADQKLYSQLGRIAIEKQKKRDLVVGVCGCIAQRDADELFSKFPVINLIVGPRAVHHVPHMLREYMETGKRQVCIEQPDFFEEYTPLVRQSTVIGYLTIMEGCNKFCSYCIVPYTRGREISKPFRLIMEEAEILLEQGYAEVQLLGQNVNDYHDKQAGIKFAGLLRRVSELPFRRIRFITSYPSQINEEVAEVIAGADNICKAIHLPPQSGSSRILRLMKRRYDREQYLNTIGLLRRHMPAVALSGDIIVGFPTETEEDFEETMSMIEEIRFTSLFSFVYSSRPGTKAAEMEDDVPYDIKVSRLQRLQQRQSEIQLEIYQALEGKEVDVLFDGTAPRKDGQLVGRTESNIVVNVYCSESYIGKIVPVKITHAGPHSLLGEVSDS